MPPRAADHACRRRTRAERRAHQGHRRAPGDLGAQLRTAAGAEGAVCACRRSAWKREVDEHGTLSSWRRGGGLRVYLDRRWNASGYGEMLAVVLPPRGFAGDPDRRRPAQPVQEVRDAVGQRPDLGSRRSCPASRPRATHFPLARTAPDPTGAWLPPNAPADRERPAARALSRSRACCTPGAAAAHARAASTSRRTTCSTIERGSSGTATSRSSQGAAYFPFIRLALARYQPMSVPGAHLSNVVLADFMPLAADRWLNVTPARATTACAWRCSARASTNRAAHDEAPARPHPCASIR